MSEFKHISSDNKQRLVQLVNKTANLVNDGMAPTDALVKAASDGDYPSEYVLRAAEAYNGAAHLAYFKSAGTEERGNSFSLADGTEALSRIVSSANVSNKTAESLPLAYVSEPNTYFTTAPLDESFMFVEKKASAASFNELQKAASSLEKQDKLSTASYQTVYNVACESLASSIKDFREKTAKVSEHRRTHWAREMIEKHGKESLDVISLATGITGAECLKLSANKVGFFSLGNAELDSLDSIVRGYNQTTNLNEKLAQAEHDMYMNAVERNDLLDTLSGVRKYANTVKTSIFGVADAAGTPNDILTQLVPGSDATPESIQRSALDSLADPSFVDASSRIDKALLLHRLMKTDPIIGSKEPKELEQAFSEISSIAPTASRSEPLLRSMLRRRLEAGQQIDDFSLNQMLNMEDKMRDQRKEYSVVPKLTGGMDSKGPTR